jgi:tRNA A-37 threonylcarbamoyl transferase component Bud32
LGKAPSIAVAVVAVGGAAALFMIPAPKGPSPGPTAADLRPIADALDGKIRGAASSVKLRAETFGTQPTIAQAIGTDTTTVNDSISHGDLVIRVQPDETVELAQIKDDGKIIGLWKSPKDSPIHPALDKAGPEISTDGKELVVSFIEDVRPAYEDQHVQRGVVSVSETVTVAELAGKLTALGTPAKIVLGDSLVAGADFPATAKTISTSLDSDAGKGIEIVAAMKPPSVGSKVPFLAGGAALAVIGLAAAAFLWFRSSKPAPDISHADTQIGDANAGQPLTPAGGVVASRTGSQPSVPIRTGTGSQPGQQVVTPGFNAGPSSTIGQVMASGGRPSPSVMSGPGSQFGRYSLIKRLGSGGMADVYLARITGEAGFEKLFALKIMHEQLARQRPDAVEHFLDEARTVARFSHPNIVQIADLGREGDNFFIAMEYIDGCDLEQLRQRATDRRVKIPVRAGIAILRKICDGLHAAHTANAADGRSLDLVHRDVKSQNILVSRRGDVKVTDFGIAKSSDTIHKTIIGQVKGTAAYMAPEQRTGQAIDRRADVYGVGAIGYEMLSGQIIDLDLANLAHLGKEGWPHLQPLGKLRTDLPPEVDDVIFRALKFEKADRYPDCSAFETALDNLATNYNLVMTDKALTAWIESEFVAYKAATAKAEGEKAGGA